MGRIGHQDRLKALDTLLNARMAHTLWVAEVTQRRTPCVAEDPAQCAFGKWLEEAAAILGGLPEFDALDAPHRELHEVYRTTKDDADPAARRERIKTLSRTLIDRIDRLEKCLNRPSRA